MLRYQIELTVDGLESMRTSAYDKNVVLMLHIFLIVTTKGVGKITILLCKQYLPQFFLVDLCSLQP